jgi:hypothetical protein
VLGGRLFALGGLWFDMRGRERVRRDEVKRVLGLKVVRLHSPTTKRINCLT